VGIALMTIFNLLVIIPMGGEALSLLWDYEAKRKAAKAAKKAADSSRPDK
jgi:Na+/alanine symporter